MNQRGKWGFKIFYICKRLQKRISKKARLGSDVTL